MIKKLFGTWCVWAVLFECLLILKHSEKSNIFVVLVLILALCLENLPQLCSFQVLLDTLCTFIYQAASSSPIFLWILNWVFYNWIQFGFSDTYYLELV